LTGQKSSGTCGLFMSDPDAPLDRPLAEKTGPVSTDRTGLSAILSRFRHKAVELIYPPQCVQCEAATMSAQALCPACWRALPLIEQPCCDRLGVPFAADYGPGLLSPQALADPPRFDRARAVCLHKEGGRALVTRLKFGERLDLAKVMGLMMAQAGREVLAGADMLIPVPLHWFRLWRRRYNQAALLADVVSGHSGIPVERQLLRRIRHTRPQVGLTRDARRTNLVKAFALDSQRLDAVKGRAVVLVDDVRTTSSTLNACAHILRKAGAARIECLTFTLVDGAEE
jgi:ComF family protein